MTSSLPTIRPNSWPILVGVLATVMLVPQPAASQSNIFGVQDRANAAEQMIVLAVQQAISSLPPAAGQGFTYEFDVGSDAFIRSELLGPISFRSTDTAEPGSFVLRISGSYFELDDSFGPVDYLVGGDFPARDQITRFGLETSAKVGLVNFAASYGLLSQLELNLTVPMVVTDADASEVFIARADSDNPVTLDDTDLIDERLRSGEYVVRKRKMSELGAIGVDFNDGTSVGLGRVSIGSKWVAYRTKRFRLALSPEFFFPSPNQAEFAGSNSAALLPRMVSSFALNQNFKLHLDLGYDADFEVAELRRLVWDLGVSAAFERVTADVGLGGSKYEEGIKWTPATAEFPEGDGTGTLTVDGDNELGTDFVDFLAGAKVRVTDSLVIAGSVSVPLTNDGFRPEVIGTFGIEAYY